MTAWVLRPYAAGGRGNNHAADAICRQFFFFFSAALVGLVHPIRAQCSLQISSRVRVHANYYTITTTCTPRWARPRAARRNMASPRGERGRERAHRAGTRKLYHLAVLIISPYGEGAKLSLTPPPDLSDIPRSMFLYVSRLSVRRALAFASLSPPVPVMCRPRYARQRE